MRTYYDYVIVGAGPAGLALVHYLRQTTNSILLVDSLETIGGCHRVVRVPYEETYPLFTEHGPRIYVSNYKNFQLLLKDMGHDFHKMFVPYHFSIMMEMLKKMTTIPLREWLHLMGAFFLFLVDVNYGKQSTIEQFGQKYQFSQETMEMLDRAARMTDGAGKDRYTMNMLFELINQSCFYQIYQPRLPNDRGLFRVWENFLKETNNIDFLLGHDVIHLSYNEQINSIHSVWAVDKKNHNTIEIKCHHAVLAVPPHAMARVLKTCHTKVKNSFLPYPKLVKFVNNTNYNPYISITFHWKSKQENIVDVHGFPTGEWGVLFIVLSDYMDMTEEFSKTLISCGVSYLDRPSFHTGKSANQSAPDEVIEETFRQLKTRMPLLPKPDVALISPQNSYDTKKKQWTQSDVSYFSSNQEQPIKSHGKVKNLYNVGTQNGQNQIAFTTLEAAISNARALATTLEPRLGSIYPLQKFWTLREVIKMISMVLFVFIVVIGILVVPKRQKK